MRAVRRSMVVLLPLAAACAGDANAGGASAGLRSGEDPGRDGREVALADGGVVLECPRGGAIGAIEVEFGCDGVTVYSCKDLSNVVIECEDGEHVKTEGLQGQLDSFFCEEGRIVRVWVKAGSNASGDGPGYGERFEAPLDNCDNPPGDGDPCVDNDPDTFCGEGDVPPGDDTPPGEGGDPQECTADSDDPNCNVD